MVITAGEADATMAERLRSRIGRLSIDVVTGRFEDVDFEPASYDALVSATAFHWIDPAIGYQVAATVLRPGGHIALWWTLFDLPDRRDTASTVLELVFEGIAPGVFQRLTDPAAFCLDIDARVNQIDQSGVFGRVEWATFDFDVTHTAQELRSLFATYSPVLNLPDRTSRALLASIEETISDLPGGCVTRCYTTILYSAATHDQR